MPSKSSPTCQCIRHPTSWSGRCKSLPLQCPVCTVSRQLPTHAIFSLTSHLCSRCFSAWDRPPTSLFFTWSTYSSFKCLFQRAFSYHLKPMQGHVNTLLCTCAASYVCPSQCSSHLCNCLFIRLSSSWGRELQESKSCLYYYCFLKVLLNNEIKCYNWVLSEGPLEIGENC